MNTRLQNQYTFIESQNRQKFLANELEIDGKWGKSVWGVTLQVELGDEVKDAIATIQATLSNLEPGNLLLPPRQSQHVSLSQVVFWGGQWLEGTWSSIADSFLAAFAEQDGKFKSYDVTFSKLIATTSGVILCGFDEYDETQTLREELQKVLPFPPETTNPNTIVHTTVARYRNKLNDPAALLSVLENQTVSARMTVRGVLLQKELVFPSLETENLAKIELKLPTV